MRLVMIVWMGCDEEELEVARDVAPKDFPSLLVVMQSATAARLFGHSINFFGGNI
jgi:hypothetical protein